MHLIAAPCGLAFAAAHAPSFRSSGIESSVLLTLIDSAVFMIGTKLAHYEITSMLERPGLPTAPGFSPGRS